MTTEEARVPDRDLTDEERIAVAGLSLSEIEEIDACLLDNTKARWNKIAMVVARALALPRWKHLPDSYLASRIRALVQAGILEGQGDLACMRFGEVRRKPGSIG